MIKKCLENKKVISVILIILIIYLSVCTLISLHLSHLTKEVMADAYANRGIYETDFCDIINKYDYETLAGYYSTDAVSCVDENYMWEYEIFYAKTFSFIIGFDSRTYVSDSCRITSENLKYPSGYNRNLRIRWKYSDGEWRIGDVYEYIQPGLLQRFLDFCYS